MKKLSLIVYLLIFTTSTLCFRADATATAVARDTDKKPAFAAVAVVNHGDITINVHNGVNINFVEVQDDSGNMLGRMAGNGSNWTYSINNISNGDYIYQVVAFNAPPDVIAKRPGKTKSNVTKQKLDVKVTDSVEVNTTRYGLSGKGRPLNVVSIEPAGATSKVLVVFEQHGYEDAYAGDGWVLVNAGNKLVEYFSANPDKLNGKALYVVCSANPDGLSDGWTNNGPGRCQISGGVDMNRDFDYYWIPRNDARSKTLSPFSAPESRALRDLIINIRPDYVFDVHGWTACTYGTPWLVKPFYDSMGIPRDRSVIGASGHLAGWAYGSGYCQDAALIELPNPYVDPQLVVDGFTGFFGSY